jgi:hypothetical protein
LFLGVLVLLLSSYLLRGKPRVGEAAGEPRVDHQLPVTGAPRLAASPPAPSPPGHLDAGIDAGGLALDEHSLMEKARSSLGRNPALAEALAREGRARFGDSPASDERDFIVVRALLNQLDRERARSEAYYYFAHHPNGRWVDKIARSLYMGVPHR